MTTTWTKIANNKKALESVPLTVGVYRYWQKDKIIYVGKSVTLRARLNSHLQNARFDQKEQAIIKKATHIDYTTTDNEFKALLLEAEQIKKHQPIYNRILKDDKSLLYIMIDKKSSYPKPRMLRAKDIPPKPKKEQKIFGPFPTTKIAESILRSIRRLVPFCQQNTIGKKPCFYAHLSLCSPCPSQIEQTKDANEKKRLQKIYKNNIQKIIRILAGDYKSVIHNLKKEIKKASQKQNYELALKLRNKISAFERYITTHSFSDKRILTYHSADSAISSLRHHLGDSPLSRIECYDASHINFQDSVVYLVVATNGELDRSEYRRFRLKRTNNKSDFDQLEEALLRRFKHKNWPNPDLIVIDGGTPQLRKLQPVLDQLPNPPLMIGLAKHPDHLIIPQYNYLKNQNVTYKRLDLPLSDPGLNLLQTLRDEAHRLGNQYRLILGKKRSAQGET